VKEHEQTLANPVPLIAARPKARPLPQHIRASPSTAAHCLIDAKLDFDHTRSAAFACDMADRDNFAKKDNSGLIRHAVERIFNGGIATGCVLRISKRRYQQSGYRQAVQYPSNLPHSCASVPSFLLRQQGAGIAQIVDWQRNQKSRYEGVLNLGIEIEEGVEAHTKLGFNLLPASLEDVHRHSGLISILQSDWSIAHLCYLVGWQQPHPINQR
jgi:hypothetical protein